MAGIKNRNGNEVKVSICDSSGNCREIKDEAEFKALLGGIKDNLGTIVGKSVTGLKLKNFYLLARILVKKYILNKGYDERHALMDSAFGIACVRVEFAGRTLNLSHGGFLLFALLDEIFIKNQYDVSEGNIRGKVVVDAGANLGTFSFLCAALGAKKVYAFEPVKGTYELLKKNIEENNLQGIIIPVNKAVGQSNFMAKIKSDYAGDGGSAIEMRKDERKETLDIEVISLDSYLSGEKIDFIKMDVEGFEENALMGAKATIAKYKPVMSLSAYHKPTDKVAIPKLIREMRQDYSIKLNNFYEEDFYCD